ncbi:kinesin-like protein KIN-14A isoform X1 [Zingiber officinale]|uniref:kinesin-like protein KIN-14A isoform X1 n=1 Tax=Zingiber officinale TaxID=94328 RepID=UPI001C4B1CCE|nr:kinesin-like protein KIN-14A isoform X1 [Zingiber officinale]
MEDGGRRNEEPCRLSFRDGRLGSRKAEEAALRRYEAASWLESIVGPLRLPPLPTEKEFHACLRSGIVLCNAINKIQPGAIPKVVVNQSAGTAWDTQPLPAYQYFENIRNFLVAVEELKLPSFEASDLERDNEEIGSAAKVVDCILTLKTYHDFQQSNGGNGWKHLKSPLPLLSTSRIKPHVTSSGSLRSKCLDMSTAKMQQSTKAKDLNDQDALGSLVTVLSNLMLNSKENIDQSLVDSWNDGKTDRAKLFSKIMSSCLDDQQLSFIQDLWLKGNSKGRCSTNLLDKHRSLPLEHGDYNYWNQLEAQEKELVELKILLSEARAEFINLQTQIQKDFIQLATQIHELSVAASGYHQAIKENRNLYNILQELKGNIRVFCRIRPIFNSQESCIEYIGNDGSLMVFDPYRPHNTRKVFQFNKVFGPQTTQCEVYNETQALIRSVMDGYNVCIFAYGQTGAGKTYTMCGTSTGLCEETGINHMALNDLFHISSVREDITYEIYVQMVEIYNEIVRDLLCQDATNSKLEIRNALGFGGLSIPNATMQSVQSSADVLNLMRLGEKNRAFSSTAMNHRSSRSHSVLTVHVHGKDMSGNTTTSCLHLVDLAGSERVDKSEATGDTLKEAQFINKSLSCLGDVIMALAQKNSHIPYRNSKLTQLLQNSLGGNAKMLMLAHVSPEADSYGETISTLKFAQRTSTVELGTPRQNKESSEIQELKDQQIDNLKKALATKEGNKVMHAPKTKEHTPVAERSRKMIDRTPPRPRRLSIENTSTSKIRASNNPDDMQVLKYTSEYSLVCNSKLSYEGLSCEKNQQAKRNADSDQSSKVCPEAPVEIENNCGNVVLLDVSEVNADMNNENPVAGGSGKDPHQPLPSSQTAHAESRIPRIEGGSRIEQRSPDRARKFDVITTPTRTSIINRSFNKVSISKGSHLRKSLQTIGRLINVSEKRNNMCPTETPTSKFVKKTNFDEKTPIISDAKLRRRQSLTTIETLGSSVSRRTSIGGKSIDSTSRNLQNMRTPPSACPSAKATKRF